MSCRVGITTDIETRKAYWERECPNMTNWKVLSQGLDRAVAQSMEDSISLAHGCDASGGGDDSDDISATWSVYRFEF